jgi:hypothetical protein
MNDFEIRNLRLWYRSITKMGSLVRVAILQVLEIVCYLSYD